MPDVDSSTAKSPRSLIRWHWLLPGASLALLAALVIHTAWLGDDAYITFRTIDNWQHGYGLRWNVTERVQAYTHPLWLFVLAAGSRMTGEPYFSSLALSIVCSIAAAAVLAFRLAKDWTIAAVAVLLLAMSRAFLDYCTSGLENPLSYVLIVIFLALYWTPAWSPRRVGAIVGVGALAAVNRLDLALLLGPALVHVAWTGRRDAWRWILLGAAPLVAWEVFSIIYYGFPFPNTAYAKLPVNIPARELVPQGLIYLADSLRHDPVTLMTMVLAFVLTMVKLEPERETMALGVILYLIYVVRIGGDFMAGRFLSLPFLVSVASIARYPGRSSWRSPALGLAALLVVLGASTGLRATLAVPALSANPERFIQANGISDERYTYSPYTRLVPAIEGGQAPVPGSLQSGLKLRRLKMTPLAWIAVGMIGYGAGPDVFIVDRVALADPLLARLPAIRPWRIGHFERKLPEGYLDTASTGQMRIANPALAEFDRQLMLITRGPIWTRPRWHAIAAMNLGWMRAPKTFTH